MEARKEGPDRRSSSGRWCLAFGAFRLARPAVKFPTADVKRKEFVDYLEVKGEVKALRSVVITAPTVQATCRYEACGKRSEG